MMENAFSRTVIAACVALLALGAASGAAAAGQPAVEPRAAEILRGALAHLAAARSLTLRAEVTTETTLPSGEKIQYPGTLEVSLRRPDRLWYRAEGELRRTAAWYDGKEFSLLDTEKNVCATTPAPADLTRLFAEMEAKLGFRPPLSVLLRDDSVAVVTGRVTSGFLVGQGTVGGTLCHHLAFRQEGIDWQVWIAAEGAPLIKRIVLTRKKAPAAPQSTYSQLAWDFATPLDDALFRFTPPPGAVRCDFEPLVR
jgi:hypothetical protein